MVSLQAGFFCITFNFRCLEKGFWSYKVHERCTQQQNQPASDGYVFSSAHPETPEPERLVGKFELNIPTKGLSDEACNDSY